MMQEDEKTSQRPITASDWELARQQFLEKQESSISRLESLLASFNSFDVVAWVGVANMTMDPNTYRESAHKGSAYSVEYTALQVLRGPFVVGAKRHPDANEFSELIALTSDITGLSPFMSLHAASAGAGSDPEGLRFSMQIAERMLRAPAYATQARAVLANIFGPYAPDLVRAMGFDVSDSLALHSAIHDHVNEEFRSALTRMSSLYGAIEKYVRMRRKGKAATPPLGMDDTHLAPWLKMSSRELSAAARRSVFPASLLGLGDILSFSVEDLSLRAKIDESRIRAFLDHASLQFGEVQPEFRVPRIAHPFKARPILAHSGRFLCPLPDQILWAIQAILEAGVKKAGVWHRYERSRHDSIVDLATKQICLALGPSAVASTSLEYPDDTATGKRAELDALIKYDETIFVVEVKAGGVRQPARLGVEAPFVDQMQDLLRAPHAQALRAKRFILSGERARFETKSGTVTIERSSVVRVLPITVNLEPLGHITGRMAADSPLSDSEADPAWAIGVFDLMSISDCLIGFGPWMPLYVTRRLRIASQKFLSAGDELDFFMLFLTNGLYYESAKDFGEVDNVMLGSFTEPLDDYYFYSVGYRNKPASKPAPKVERPMQAFVNSLERSQRDGWLEAALIAIGLGGKSRGEWLRLLERAKKKGRKDGRLHDLSFADSPGGGWGLTTFVAPEWSSQRREQLTAYVREKRRQHRVEAWYGVGIPLQDGGSAWDVTVARRGP
jgi:hypothetical protein